jgi:AcrR family transcriptional regulator
VWHKFSHHHLGWRLLEKKQALINSAIKLFARNGFDATSTASIGIHAGVTEPLIHYHFKNKDGLFTYILDSIFSEYFSRFDALPIDTDTEFEKLDNLIKFQFQFADDFPDETHIIVRGCPAKLQDAAHTCAQYVSDQRKRLNTYVSTCLKSGINSGEFKQVSIKATTELILSMVTGLTLRKRFRLAEIDGLIDATVDFCRSSLINKA